MSLSCRTSVSLSSSYYQLRCRGISMNVWELVVAGRHVSTTVAAMRCVCTCVCCTVRKVATALMAI